MHFRQKLTFMAFGSILTLAGYLLITSTSDVTAQRDFDELKPSTSDVTAEGNEPYTPTKLQWFVLNINATYSSDWGMFRWKLLSKPPNTVVVFLSYRKSAKYSEVKAEMDHIKFVIDKKKELYDWDWIQVEFETRIGSD